MKQLILQFERTVINKYESIVTQITSRRQIESDSRVYEVHYSITNGGELTQIAVPGN